MSRFRDTGVTFYEDDRGGGPFKIRIGGTSEFVSNVDPNWERAWPPGKVDVVIGWENPLALTYETMDSAIKAAVQVWDIEGFHTSIESSVCITGHPNKAAAVDIKHSS